MSTLVRSIRVAFRFVAAFLFWLHALFLFQIPSPPIGRWASRLGLDLSETIIILLLAVLTVLSSYGIRRFSVDVAYIYFFPFIAIYRTGWLLVSLFTTDRRPQQSREVPSAPATAPSQGQDKRVTGNQEQTILKPPSKQTWAAIIAGFLEPFRQFALLWCLLLLLSSKQALVWLALAVVLLQLCRALYRVLTLAVFSLKWLSSIEEEIRTGTKALLEKLMAVSEDVVLDKGLRDLVQRVVGLRTGLQLIQNRRRVRVIVSIGSICAAVMLHLYFALFFSFAYYGVARVQSVDYSWGEALVNSVFIPFFVSTLPRNNWLRVVGGIQCVLILAMSIGTLFAYVQRKFDSVYKVTQELNVQLQVSDVKTKLDRLQQRLSPATAAKTGKDF